MVGARTDSDAQPRNRVNRDNGENGAYQTKTSRVWSTVRPYRYGYGIDHTRGGGAARRPPPSLEALELGRVHHVLAVEGAGAVQAERAERDQPYLDRAASGVGLLGRVRVRMLWVGLGLGFSGAQG